MSNFNITTENQKIIFDKKERLISIEGVFITEDPKNIFESLNIQIDDFLLQPKESLTIEFRVEYFNTIMSLNIRNLLRKIQQYKDSINIEIKWYFELEDEEMEEVGEEFQNLFEDINFVLIGVDNF